VQVWEQAPSPLRASVHQAALMLSVLATKQSTSARGERLIRRVCLSGLDLFFD
jgi:hypothetical protein